MEGSRLSRYQQHRSTQANAGIFQDEPTCDKNTAIEFESGHRDRRDRKRDMPSFLPATISWRYVGTAIAMHRRRGKTALQVVSRAEASGLMPVGYGIRIS